MVMGPQALVQIRFHFSQYIGSSINMYKSKIYFQIQAAEQSGTIWDLQEGLSSNNSSAQQGGWQAFANPSRDAEFSGQTHAQQSTTNHTDSMPVRAPPPQNSRRSTFGGETWKLAQERVSSSPSPLPATSNSFYGPKTLVGGATSNTNQLSPAGWAGF